MMKYIPVLASIFLACAVVAVAFAQNHTLQLGMGRYVVATGGDGGTAWRLDTVTGAMSYCVTALTSLNPAEAGKSYRTASCTTLKN